MSKGIGFSGLPVTGFPVVGSNSPTFVANFPIPGAAKCVWPGFPEVEYPGGGYGPERVSAWVIPIRPLLRGLTVSVSSGTAVVTLSAPFGLVVCALPGSETL